MSLLSLYNLLADRGASLKTASGTPGLPALTAAGNAVRRVVASGSVTLPAVIGSGDSVRLLASSGSVTLPALTASGNATTPITVTVSGEFIGHSVANGLTARAGVRVNSDGTIDKLEGTTYTQIDAATDWRIPNGSGAGFHVRFTKGFLDPAPDVGTLTTWLALSTSREVYYEETASNSQDGGTITVAISDDAGSTTLDSGNYPLTATVGLPP